MVANAVNIKMASTLRVVPKGKKPYTRIVYRFGRQSNSVKDFLV